MRIFSEIHDIYEHVSKINDLVNSLNNTSLDAEGIHFYSASLVVGLDERDGYLYDDDNCIAELSDDYYVNQSVGYCGDDFSGYLYFKTNQPGEFIRFYFECQAPTARSALKVGANLPRLSWVTGGARY